MRNESSLIALFGTSADPPTNGHLALLEGLLNLFPKVITWASNNPLKKHQESLESRHELLTVLVQELDHPNLNIVQELSSPRTLNTVETATLIWPKHSFVFVIGSDLVTQIPSWFKVQELLKKTRLGIALREGWPITLDGLKTIEMLGGEIDLLPLSIPASSSSNVRKKAAKSQIPKSILPLLIENNLYGFSRSPQ